MGGGSKEKPAPAAPIVECTECNKVFFRVDTMRKHRNAEHKCKDCNGFFKNVGIHAPSCSFKKEVCDICSESVPGPRMAAHRDGHKCSSCGRIERNHNVSNCPQIWCAIHDCDKPCDSCEYPMPDFLLPHYGEGHYNVAVFGHVKVGKSAWLNVMLGGKKAKTGACECTLEPGAYPLNTASSHSGLSKFMEKLPSRHKACMKSKLQAVLVWDMPGEGTMLHQSATYVRNMGLRYMDCVCMVVGEAVLEMDIEILRALIPRKIPHTMVRSKFDMSLSSHWADKAQGKDDESDEELPVELTEEEKRSSGIELKQYVVNTTTKKFREKIPNFSDKLFLVAAEKHIPRSNPDRALLLEMLETQDCINALLLGILYHRWGHDFYDLFQAGGSDLAQVEEGDATLESDPHSRDTGSARSSSWS